MTALTARPTTSRATLLSSIGGLFAGSLAANGVPHTVFGVLGQDHMTPFGTDAGINLIWGLANIAVAVAIAVPRATRRAYVPFTIAAAVGALGTAVSLIVLWS